MPRLFYSDLQLRILHASLMLSKLVDEPIARDGVNSESPADLDDLAELASAAAKIVDPLFQRFAFEGDLHSSSRLYDDLISSHVNDYLASELRHNAEKIREDKAQWGESGIGSNRADDDYHNRHAEPVL